MIVDFAMLSQSQVSNLNNGTNSSKGEWKEHLIQVPWGHVAGKQLNCSYDINYFF